MHHEATLNASIGLTLSLLSCSKYRHAQDHGHLTKVCQKGMMCTIQDGSKSAGTIGLYYKLKSKSKKVN